jgi:DNA-binding IclR family transcriptional regulator
VVRLAFLREASVPMRDIAMRVLQRISDATGETAHLGQLQGSRLATLAYTYSSTHGVAVRMEDADVVPLHASASGHAMLAFAAPDFRDRILAGPLPAFTPDTPVAPDDIRACLTRVRATGLAELIGGFEADVHSLAVPLFDGNAIVTGAIAVAAPAARMTPALRARVIAALRDGAREIMEQSGGTPPQ